MTVELPTVEDTRSFAEGLAKELGAGDVVLLEGPLGAGKTTLVRLILAAIGHGGPVRSPTFNLIQTFDTVPPVMHADLYRVQSAEGLGLEEYLDSHLCLIEWPDRLRGMVEPEACHRVALEFAGDGRRLSLLRPVR
jgi:tRNA threonylcarbamoyladenosine biosynthesis protein TsaE